MLAWSNRRAVQQRLRTAWRADMRICRRPYCQQDLTDVTAILGTPTCSILGAGTFRNWQLATREHVAGKYAPNHDGLERCCLGLP